MNRIKMYTMVFTMSISCLIGCGDKENINHVSSAPCESVSEEETKCYHENTDSSGICPDCGEDVGILITSEEFYKYFDILIQEKWSNYYDIVVVPRDIYDNPTYENVFVSVCGTKLAHDGFTKNRGCNLVTIELDENGTGTFSGFIDDCVSVDYAEVGSSIFATPRIHINNGLSEISDSYEESANMSNNEVVIKEDEFYLFFDMVNTGLHVDVSPSEHYWGCRFSNCQAIIQGYIGTQFKDLGYVDINERGFGRAKWYGLTAEEQNQMQIEKVYINPGTFGDEVPKVYLDDKVYDVEAWIPKDEKIEIGKYDFDKYFNLTRVTDEDPVTGWCLYEISPKEEYKYCRFYGVEVYWTTVIHTDFGDRIDEYGPLDLKIDGTESIPWCVDETSEFTMGRNGEIGLK